LGGLAEEGPLGTARYDADGEALLTAFDGGEMAAPLATALMHQGLSTVPLLTVHAAKPEAARFWESLGFRSDDRNGRSHSLWR
jgi:hypothetical protein